MIQTLIKSKKTIIFKTFSYCAYWHPDRLLRASLSTTIIFSKGLRLNFFNFDVKKVILFSLLLIIPFLFFRTEKESKNSALTRPFSIMMGLVQNAYSAFSSGVRGTTGLYLNLVDIKKNNRLLVNENAELRAQLGELTELKLENERLNNLLSFKQKANMKLLAAKIIGGDLLYEHDTVTINRGKAHGVKRGMAAITVGGVVGYILDSDIYSSRIILLTDRYMAIDGLIQRTRARGIVEGHDKESCRLNYIKRNENIEEGDLVVTSGLDNIFPKGFPIGRVTNVSKSKYGVTQTIDIKPSVNPSNLEEVFVILDAKNQNFEKEQNEKKDEATTTPTEESPVKEAIQN